VKNLPLNDKTHRETLLDNCVELGADAMVMSILRSLTDEQLAAIVFFAVDLSQNLVNEDRVTRRKGALSKC
jgi:hypothetical protein